MTVQQDCITWERVAGRLRPVSVSGKFKWSDQLDETLRELGRDHSASEIGAILGCGRNAVIGRCFRKGIALKGTEARRAAVRKANAKAAEASFVRAQERLRRAQERRDAAMARAELTVAAPAPCTGAPRRSDGASRADGRAPDGRSRAGRRLASRAPELRRSARRALPVAAMGEQRRSI